MRTCSVLWWTRLAPTASAYGIPESVSAAILIAAWLAFAGTRGYEPTALYMRTKG
ncbi:hypothetical protein BD311DRAFT_757502 [Dichomitus squalens]|uniref:Uncharacterized protein n=1 Tax=Dichomitus squalens TaxID=114155 RepID=A0A4Q9MS07_9APHY|nr:hypothetical protein BD311DRAFT_757502 [Dichomitus squalens]